MRRAAFLFLALAFVTGAHAPFDRETYAQGRQAPYDLLIKGGHLIDARNGIDAVRDVAIKDGKIAAVAANIAEAQATKTINATGLYVTPGLVDIHVHVYTGEGTSYSRGFLSVPPDGFALESCTTTVADAGGSGWRNFDDFKARIIDKSKTRVVAFLNIVGNGMGGGTIEQNIADMEGKPTGEMALKHKGVIVGIKSAHFNGPEWHPYIQAEEAGKMADIPVMVDFGSARVRTIKELFEKYFRPGDIYTHAYAGGGRMELMDGKVNPAMIAAQKRGIVFDVGHGGGSFRFAMAVQAFKEGFYPNSLSTDLHVGSMNAGMKDIVNVMSKFLALGMPLKDVVLRSTWNPAREIKLEQLGHLSVGAPADVAVLRLEKGKFGFLDQLGGRLDGTQRLTCELTLRDGEVVYDLNGLAAVPWEKLPPPGRGRGSGEQQVTVSMSQYDYERTGANLQERVLNPSNVNATGFGKLFSRRVDDSVYALPLIVPNLEISGQRRNVMFIASMGNTVYAFDADDPAQSEPLWSRNLGTPAPGDSWIGPTHHGILGTPFIDVPTGTLYVVALVRKDNEDSLWVNALDIYDGSPKYNSPQRLSFPFAGPEGTLTNVKGALQRAGLLVVNGVLYIACANIVPDPNDQHWSQEGFLQTFNARDLTKRLAVFQTTPTGRKGGIWQGGRGIATDGLGNIYVSTAGGFYDGVTNFGSSTLKFTGPSLKLTDWFTPDNHEYLFLQNIDMSAGGVTLIPNSPLMFSGGKEGVVFLLNRNDMGKLEGATRGPLQRFQAGNGCGRKDCAQTLGTAFYSRGRDGVLYVWDRGDVLRAYDFKDSRFVTTPAAVSAVKPGMTGGPSVSANGSDLSSGIVWAVTTQSTRSGGLSPGTLRAFRASDVSQEIYNSDMNNGRDAPGDFSKFAPPVVANGKVYVPTQSKAVSVYGLLRQ